MELEQFITLIITILGPTLISVYVFYKMTSENIHKIESKLISSMDRMDDRHREDVKLMDDKWERLFTRMDDKINLMQGQK